MPEVSHDQILTALRRIIDPASGANVIDSRLIGGLNIKAGNVVFSIETTPDQANQREALRKACEAAVLALPGVASATAVLTAHRPGVQAAAAPQPSAKLDLPGIGAVIAVASGKGGVGKSTVALNLALALARLGRRVGLLDADIYGPSVPRLVGLSGKPQVNENRKLMPMVAFGMPTMSIGYLVAEEQAVIWRGPMVTSALNQMLTEVAWGTLDILVIDMPPGTGDAQLTLSQRVPLAGAVIVSTPQDIALIDARKGLAMFEKVHVPVLGIIENMSYFLCPRCGERSDIFGHGGARETAERLAVPFLGEVPLHMAIRETSDAGTPIVASAPDSPQAEAFLGIAAAVLDGLSGAMPRPAPRIVVI